MVAETPNAPFSSSIPTLTKFFSLHQTQVQGNKKGEKVHVVCVFTCFVIDELCMSNIY